MKSLWRVACFAFVLLMAVMLRAQATQPCVATGQAIIHDAPPQILPGYSIEIEGAFNMVAKNNGACPNTPCDFTFDCDVTVTVSPQTTPISGDICLTLAGGSFTVACGPFFVGDEGGFHVAVTGLRLESSCGNIAGWTLGFWYDWGGVGYLHQKVVTADLTCQTACPGN